jgi:hypothetical protein
VIARCLGASPRLADTAPVTTRAMSTAVTVTGIRTVLGGNRIAISGSSAPTVNDGADDTAACQGLLRSSRSIPSSTSYIRNPRQPERPVPASPDGNRWLAGTQLPYASICARLVRPAALSPVLLAE